MQNRILIVRYDEIALKKGNRRQFEEQLCENLRARMPEGARVCRRYGRLLVTDVVDARLPESLAQARQTFGVANVSCAVEVPADMTAIEAAAVDALRARTQTWETFRVRTTRQDKTFPHSSMEVSRTVGAAILRAIGGDTRVRMKGADAVVLVEVTDRGAFVSAETLAGPGGLPVGVTGRVLCLLSGGIDSPVAAWRMMKRGCIVDFVHFHSAPYTNRASIDKVRELARLLNDWQNGLGTLTEVPFLCAQKAIMQETAAKYRVILYRRAMVRIAQRVAQSTGATALVTGECLAQVASQTLENLAVIEEAATLPMLRPLVGMDKKEIMATARAIGTYDTSVIPHQDCCSLFVPRHPATRSRLADIIRQEARLDLTTLLRYDAHDKS